MSKPSKPISPYPKAIYERNAEIYKLLANPIRLEILNILKGGEASLDDLSEIIGIRKPNTSQHLAILRYLRMVKMRRVGQRAYYTIADPRIVEPCKILKELWGDKPL